MRVLCFQKYAGPAYNLKSIVLYGIRTHYQVLWVACCMRAGSVPTSLEVARNTIIPTEFWGNILIGRTQIYPTITRNVLSDYPLINLRMGRY